MKELEEVNCEVRRVIDIQQTVLERLNKSDGGQNDISNGVAEDNGAGVPNGGFLNQVNYAWMSYACRLVVFNVKTGENVSSWVFRDRVTCVCQFPSQLGELPLLLVGLDNGAIRVRDSSGMVCVFDCATSRVLRAIKVPAGVEQVSVVYGGTEWEELSEKRPDNLLPDASGIACVALRNLQHIMINLRRASWDSPDSLVLMDESSPAQLEFPSTNAAVARKQSGKEKHPAINLLDTRIERHIGFHRDDFEANAFLEENLTTVLVSSPKIGCLISGCLGRVIIWQNDGSVGWISPAIDDSLMVTHLGLLEPIDDPRPFYYLWVVFQDEAAKVPPLLRMYAMLFERKYWSRGTNLYFNLEAEPSPKFEFELDASDRVISLCAIERKSSLEQTDSVRKRCEENLLLISTEEKTLLFDLNQWYKEQMPLTIGECQNPNSVIACYQIQSHSPTPRNEVISSAYVPATLQDFPNNSPSASEELYYPNSLSLEWVELSASKVSVWMSRGIQADLLRDMAIAGPIFLTQPAETFHKCLSVGLVPFNVDVSFTNDHNVQRDMLLSLCLEQRWATFLVRCAKEWSDGSAAYLYPAFVRWGVQRAASIKMIADRLCVPLFDQSGNNIGETEVKTLRFCSQQLECLSNVVGKLPIETSELLKQRRALRRVSTYLQVLLWFYDVNLLPESQEIEDGPAPMFLALRIPYPYAKLYGIYREKREELKRQKSDGCEDLFIDELIARECPVLKLQWESEAGDLTSNGHYPPSSLQSLLRTYLASSHQTEAEEMECKHQITTYLFMDLAMLLKCSYPRVDDLIKYPSAFKMSPSRIKLTQAFWLLDHEDYQGFLDTMTGQLVSDSDVKDWHHKLILRTLVRNNQHKLALTYLHVRKPPLNSLCDQSTLIKLSVEHGLVQSAFHRRPQAHYAQLLVSFFQACKAFGKLSDILHLALDAEEEEVFVKFLEDEKSTDVRLLYYLQRCRYAEANDFKPSQSSGLSKEAQASTMLNAYKATLPEVIKRFTINMARNNPDMDLESRFPRPMSHRKSCNKTLSVYENVVRKAQETYLRREKSQIPFISVPCLSLKSYESNFNASCVHFPQLADRTQKRTLEQAYDGEETGTQSPEGAKRRKLENQEPEVSEVKENSFNVALSTPLVKRKGNVTLNKELLDSPHSILKIRQMIRNSTSPTVGTSQVPEDQAEKKTSRQIRFSIGGQRRSASNEDVNGEEVSSTKAEEDMSLSNIVDESPNETTILSDGSFCNIRDSPRPRPSLRRICLESSRDLDEPVNKFLKKNLMSTPLKTPAKKPLNASVLNSARKGTPSRIHQGNVSLSTTVYTPSILSDDSVTDLSALPWKQKDRRGSSLIFSEEDDRSIQKMDVVEEQQEARPEEVDEEMDDSSLAYEEPRASPEDFKHKNGGITQTDVSYEQFEDPEESKPEDAKRQEEENEEEFESLSTTASSVQFERKDRFSFRKAEEVQKSIETSVTTVQTYDITDDESAISEDEMVLAFEATTSNNDSVVVSPLEENVYDVSNITDDESDTEAKRPGHEEPDHNATTASIRSSRGTRQAQNKGADPEESLNASRLRQRRSNETPSKDTEGNEETNVRVTRSRRASSVAKDFPTPTINSPAKLTEKRSTRRASSLAKDLLSASVVLEEKRRNSSGSDDSTIATPKKGRGRRASSLAKDLLSASVVPEEKQRQGNSSDSDDSTTVATPKKGRGRRASSLAKDLLSASVVIPEEKQRQRNSSESDDSVSVATPKKGRGRRASSVAQEAQDADETQPSTPVRRSTRRAASVQKEVPEVPKVMTRRKRVTSVSSLTSEQDEEAALSESKTSKRKAAEPKKTATRTKRATKAQSVVEEEAEEPARPARRRGSSVPKDSVIEAPKGRGLSTSSRDTEHEVQVPAKTRSHRLSIQSIPEELEDVLNASTTSRTSTEGKAASRQRRAVSMEPAVPERKKTARGVRATSVLKETIAEEDTGEETQKEAKTTAKKAPVRRTRKASETSSQDLSLQDSRTATKTRRTRKAKGVDSSNQFSFSQPGETEDVPADQRAIGGIPGYVFSPPHTRSKRTTADHHFPTTDQDSPRIAQVYSFKL